MMSSDTSTFLFSILFFLPGVITNDLVQRMTSLKEQGDYKYIYHCLIFSALNLAVCGSLCGKIVEMMNETIVAYAVAEFVISVIAVILGLIIGALLQKRFLEKLVLTIPFLRNCIKIKFNEPSSWDYAMEKAEEGDMRVILKNGSSVCGKYTNGSVHGHGSGHKDIYLDTVYQLDESGRWTEDPEIDGIYIAEDQIAKIEFMKKETEEKTASEETK